MRDIVWRTGEALLREQSEKTTKKINVLPPLETYRLYKARAVHFSKVLRANVFTNGFLYNARNIYVNLERARDRQLRIYYAKVIVFDFYATLVASVVRSGSITTLLSINSAVNERKGESEKKTKNRTKTNVFFSFCEYRDFPDKRGTIVR